MASTRQENISRHTATVPSRRKGSPRALLEALKRSPGISYETAEELRRNIREGKTPLRAAAAPPTAAKAQPLEEAAYHGVVKNGTVVLEDGAHLPDGTAVVVSVPRPRKGSPQAILAALEKGPPVRREDAEELLRLIREGKRPARLDDPLSRARKRRR